MQAGWQQVCPYATPALPPCAPPLPLPLPLPAPHLNTSMPQVVIYMRPKLRPGCMSRRMPQLLSLPSLL